MPPLRLTVNPQALFHSTVVDFAHPAFARVTHLHLRWSHPDTCAPWEILAAPLPCLTHLAFSVLAPVLFSAALAHCARLRVLVYMLSLLYDEDVSDLAHEARFVPMLPCWCIVYGENGKPKPRAGRIFETERIQL
ncbi:hypothetical protein C8R43DRAFT_1119660 [Mycena crocata]|nr:hypothetical protein C8R43DRAFT_1119660 [Mycena crocata]